MTGIECILVVVGLDAIADAKFPSCDFGRASTFAPERRTGIVRASTIIADRESDNYMKPAEGSTIIGKSVTIRGEVSGKEDLYMDGIVEGTISLPESRLTVGPNARVIADLAAHDVVIYGLVEGNIRATGRIELRESAVVKGDIVAERLSIEENASIKGRVELLEVTGSAGRVQRPGADLSGASAPASSPA
jgi:cytoskeletal protein CcmA (bactofilin family)